MTLRRYVASGRGGPGAILAVLVASLLAGAILGVIEGVVSRWLSLFLIFPALIGAAAGATAAGMVQRCKLRAPVLAFVLGFLGGAAGYAAEHVTDYVRFRSDFTADLKHDQPSASDPALSDELDRQLAEATGAPGFRGYLELAAREGVRIKRTTSHDDGIAFKGTAAWILWGVELLIAALVAAALAASRARDPFCEDCDAWYGPPVPVAGGGAGTKVMGQQVTSALEVGDVDGAARAFFGPRPKPQASFQLTAATCGRCAGDAACRLDRVVQPRRGNAQRSKIATWLMTRAELASLRDALGRAKPGAP